MEKASEDLYYLERLAVVPDERGQGYGKMLVNHVFERVGELSGRKISIGTIDEQVELKAWYEGIGFHVTETKKFPSLPFTVAFMEYELP